MMQQQSPKEWRVGNAIGDFFKDEKLEKPVSFGTKSSDSRQGSRSQGLSGECVGKAESVQSSQSSRPSEKRLVT